MAFSKAYAFNMDIYLLSLIGKAISHPARILVIKAIAQQKVASFAEIKDYTFEHLRKGDNSTISNHIKYLKRMNLIKYESNEKHEGYVLNTKLGDIIKYILDILQSAKNYKIEPGEAFFMETSEGGFKNNMIGEPMETDLSKV